MTASRQLCKRFSPIKLRLEDVATLVSVEDKIFSSYLSTSSGSLARFSADKIALCYLRSGTAIARMATGRRNEASTTGPIKAAEIDRSNPHFRVVLLSWANIKSMHHGAVEGRGLAMYGLFPRGTGFRTARPRIPRV